MHYEQVIYAGQNGELHEKVPDMALDQKVRSLYCRLQAGLQFREENGVAVLPFKSVPYELEDIIAQWILALPQELHLEFLCHVDGAPVGLTEVGWNAFVTWMLASLREAQAASNFKQKASNAALKSLA